MPRLVAVLFLLTFFPFLNLAQDCSLWQDEGRILLKEGSFVAASDSLIKAYRCWGRHRSTEGRALIPELVRSRLGAADFYRHQKDEKQWVRYTTLAAAIASRDTLPQALDILARALEGSDTLALATRLKLHTDYAFRLKQSSRFYQAKAQYEQARQLAERSNHPDGRFYPFILKPLANIYTRLGENKTARILLEDCLQHYRDTLGKLHAEYEHNPSVKKTLLKYLQRTAYNYLDLGIAAQDEDRLETALAAYDRGLQLLDDYADLDEMPYVQNYFLINQATCLLLQEDTTAARNILRQLQASDLSDPEQEFYTREISAQLALANQQHDLAKREYQMARDSAIAYYTPHLQRREIAQFEIELGNIALEQKDWTTAKDFFQLALERVIPAYQASKEALPESQYFYPENVILSGLDGLAEAYQNAYRNQGQGEALQVAQQAYMLAIEMESILLDTYLQQSSQLQLLAESSQRHEQLVLLLLESYRQTPTTALADQLFFHFEQSRANLWRRHSADQEALALAHQTLPAPIVQQELRLNGQIKSATEQLVQLREEGIPWPDARYLALEKELLQLRELRESNRQVMAELQPQYGQLQAAVEPLSLETVHQKLDRNQAHLVEFLYGQDSILAIHLSPDAGFQVKAIHRSEPLMARLEKVLYQISNEEFARSNDRNPEVYQSFASNAAYLYQELLFPFFGETPPEKLYLIPDGPLQALPFELVLSTQDYSDLEVTSQDLPAAYAHLPYLFRSSIIQYGFAASAIWEGKARSTTQQQASYLGLVPDYTNCQLGLTSEESITYLRNISKEKGDAAQLHTNQVSKKELIERAKQYQWLHFHGHGLANDEDPLRSALAFSCRENEENTKDLLYAYEIAGMELSVPLLFLGACNTGRGKVARGEGVLSLSRAFQQAGVHQIVQTLWEADDLSTALFAQYFFAGSDPSQDDYGPSLQHAREQYLLEPSNNAYPYYWAAFVLTGKDSVRLARPNEGRPRKVGIAIILGIILLSGVWFYSRAAPFS